MVQSWVVRIEGQIAQFLSSRSSTVQGAQMEDSKERVKRKLLRDLCQLTDFDAWLPATGLVFWVCYAWVENASKLGFSSPNDRVSWWATNWSMVLCGDFVIGGGRGSRQRRAGDGEHHWVSRSATKPDRTSFPRSGMVRRHGRNQGLVGCLDAEVCTKFKCHQRKLNVLFSQGLQSGIFLGEFTRFRLRPNITYRVGQK